jgi:hypothetical protein
MTKNNRKSLQTYLGNDAGTILEELSDVLMLSKSSVVRLALRKLHTSSREDMSEIMAKRLVA